MRFNRLLTVLLPALILLSGFQNCVKYKFTENEFDGNFIMMSIKGESSVLLEEGQAYSLKVMASNEVMASGLDYSRSRLLKIGGACAANHMQPWDKGANPATETSVVSPLINGGLPYQADAIVDVAKDVVPVVGTEVALVQAAPPAIEASIPWNPSEGAPVILTNPESTIGGGSGSGTGNNNVPGSGSGGGAGSGVTSGTVVTLPITETVQTPIPSGKVSMSSMAAAKVASEGLDFIDLGTNEFVYDTQMASRMNGCRWLGCVRSNDQKYEACVEFKTLNSSCNLGGQSVAHDGSIVAYQSSVVPFGQSCVAETRVCNNGSLSGSYASTSCSVAAPAACSLGGSSVAHGSSVVAYQSASVPFGQTCVAQTRSCNNGVLSGAFLNTSCSVSAPAACSLNGVNVAHGSSVVAYQSASVPFGQTCAAQTRTCNNGVLSGSFAQSACAVGAPGVCSFNGQTVAHGASVVAFQSDAVPFGQTCVSQSRVCNNGSLSGTFAQAACVVEPPVCGEMGGEELPTGGCRFHKPGNFNFVTPKGVSQIKVTVIGAGGGASSRDNNKWSGAHGAGGGAAIKTYSVNRGEIFNFSVGTGGQGIWWGYDGVSGTDSQFIHPQGAITGKGGEAASVWTRQMIGGRIPFGPWIATVAKGGTGIGGDVNCQGGNGGFCLNGEFACPAQDAPLCDGKAGGKSFWIQGYGGGGGASEFGGNGVVPFSASGAGYATPDAIAAEPDYQASCGGGAGGNNLWSRWNGFLLSQNGSHGCVIIQWVK